MTKGEAYLRAWKLGFKGDFSEINEIYHPEYSAIDDATGVKVNLNMDKTIGSELGKSMIIGPQTILFEDENKVKIQTFDKYKDADIEGFSSTSQPVFLPLIACLTFVSLEQVWSWWSRHIQKLSQHRKITIQAVLSR